MVASNAGHRGEEEVFVADTGRIDIVRSRIVPGAVEEEPGAVDEDVGPGMRTAGDTGDCRELEELLTDADVAIMELTHPTAKADPGHLDVERMACLTRDARRHGTRFFATHMTEPPSASPEGVTLLEDGKTYWV